MFKWLIILVRSHIPLKQVHMKPGGPDAVHVARSSLYMFHHIKTAQVIDSLLAGLNSKMVCSSVLSSLALSVAVSFSSQ